jgi:hypothetical protein
MNSKLSRSAVANCHKRLSLSAVRSVSWQNYVPTFFPHTTTTTPPYSIQILEKNTTHVWALQRAFLKHLDTHAQRGRNTKRNPYTRCAIKGKPLANERKVPRKRAVGQRNPKPLYTRSTLSGPLSSLHILFGSFKSMLMLESWLTFTWGTH